MFDAKDISKDFDDVERFNGVPLIICRWGVKKVFLNGQIFLAAMSPDEQIYERNRADSGVHETLSSPDPKCVMISGAWCAPLGRCEKCRAQREGGGWDCKCTHS